MFQVSFNSQPFLQRCAPFGCGNVSSKARPLYFCSSVSVPELLWADTSLQPTDRTTPSAAHPPARVLHICEYSTSTTVCVRGDCRILFILSIYLYVESYIFFIIFILFIYIYAFIFYLIFTFTFYLLVHSLKLTFIDQSFIYLLHKY